ncbi:MAG: amino acid permease [Thermoproteota archaeon]|nr:amino acid permease [Candidatus Rehaiarchaeum fermentans]
MDKPSKELYVRKSSGLVRGVKARDALIANLVSMGLLGPVLYVMYAVSTSPSGNIPVTVLIGLCITLTIAYVYWMLATSMPRTGGDYIYTSRILHPLVGFFESFLMFFVMITSFVSYDAYLAVTSGFSYMFINFGFLTHNSSLVSMGMSLINNTTVILIITLALVIIIIILMLQPVKRIMQVIMGLFFITLVIYLIYVYLLISVGNSGFIHNFNLLSGTSYQTVVNSGLSLAATNNVSASYNLYGTMVSGLYFVMLSFIGYANSSYYAGEVSGNPFRSQGIAILGSAIIYGIALFTIYLLQFNVFGHNFLVAMTQLYYYSPSTYPTFGLPSLVGMPSGVFLVNFLTNNPYIGALIAFGIGLTFFMWSVIFFLVPTRYLFAWSFDRIIPQRLSNTTKKGVPYYTIIIYGILAIVFVVLAIYTSILSFYAYAMFGFYLAIDIVLIAGAVFPYRKKDIFNSAHKYVRMKLFGVPVLTIIASIGFIFSTDTMISTILPSITGFPINLTDFVPLIAAGLIAIIIYLVSYYYNKSKGLPVELIGKEIPPL